MHWHSHWKKNDLIAVFSVLLNALESTAARIYYPKEKKREAKSAQGNPCGWTTQRVGIKREQLQFITII